MEATEKSSIESENPSNDTPKPPAKKATAKETALGCGCLVIILFAVLCVIGVLFGGKNEAEPATTPTPATATQSTIENESEPASNVPESTPSSESEQSVATALPEETEIPEISDAAAAERMLQKLKEDMHVPDLNAIVDAFGDDTIAVRITLPYEEEIRFSSAVALSDAMADSISKWRRAESVWGDYIVTVKMLNARKDAPPELLGNTTYTSEADFFEWVSAPGQPEGKTEDQEWRDKQPAFKEALVAIFADGIMPDIDIEITEFTPRDIAFRAVLPRPINSMAEAEIIGKATVIAAVQWAVAEGVNPVANNMDARGRVVIREKGVTGSSLIRYYGTARYSIFADQVDWEPEG